MRRLLLLALVLGLTACGEEERAAPALAPVRLTIDAPSDLDTVEDSSIEVSGRVVPAGARVLVDGEEASVSGGAFSTSVELEAGTNVIDIQAGAPRHPATMTALRIVREVPIEVPDIAGESPEDAAADIEAVGLKPEFNYSGGIIDALLPGTDGACGSDPPAGERVRVGTTVTIDVKKSC